MINKEAFDAFTALNSNQTDNIIEKLQEFEKYLIQLNEKINSGSLKQRFIYHWTFINEVDSSHYKNYCRANIALASQSFSRVILKLQHDGINHVNRRFVINFICDLKQFIRYFDKSQDYDWLIINTNTHITNFYFDLAKNSLWNGSPGGHQEEQLVLASSTPFIIRQGIEYKVKRVLGVEYVLINDKPDIRVMDKCFQAIDLNKPYYKLKNFEWDIVKLIYNWTHVYVHGGYRPDPWKIESALHYLEDFFYSGRTTQSNSVSIHAAIEIHQKDLETVKKQTENIIVNESKGDVKINWLNNLDLAIVKDD